MKPGISVTCQGTIIDARISTKMAFLPGNLCFASTNAASDATISPTMVLATATNRLLP